MTTDNDNIEKRSSSSSTTSSPSAMADDAELEANWREINSTLAQNAIIPREWFFSKMDKIVDMNSHFNSISSSNNGNGNNNHNPTLKNVTVVFGQAGSGKTFLMQMLSSMNRFEDRVLLPFFCKHVSSDSNPATPSDFLTALEQAIRRTFKTPLRNPKSNHSSASANHSVTFREHILRLLSGLAADPTSAAKYQLTSKRYLLLVDSIDLRADLCELISTNLHAFPPFLHVLLTARPKRYRGITKMFSGARKIVLDDIRKSNVYNDLAGYITVAWEEHQQKQKQETMTTEPEIEPTTLPKAVCGKIVQKSNGCVLYVRLLLDCLSRDVFSLGQLDTVIGGTLNGLYLALFTALFSEPGAAEDERRQVEYRAVLSLLHRGNSFQASLKEVRAKLGLGEEEEEYLADLIDQLVRHCLVVVDPEETTTSIRLVHGSLFEWLSDVKHSARFVCHTSFPVAVISNSQTTTELAPTSSSSQRNQQNVQQPTRNLINTKYINDNADDSLNEISDDMLYERGEVAVAGALAFDPSLQGPQIPYLPQAALDMNETLMAPLPKGHHAQHFKGRVVDASLMRNVNNTLLNNVGRQADEDCLVESEDDGQGLMMDGLQTVELMSKQQVEISKEYLSKLYSKFESALHLSDLKTLSGILARYGNVLVNTPFIEGKTPIYWAIKRGNLRLLELLIEAGADVNAICDAAWGYSPLLVALMQHSVDLVELLLEADADVEQLDRYSMPPLLHALLVGCSPEIVRLLLYWGAGTDFIDEAGRSVLHFAANEAKTWPETIRLLLTVGCDEQARDNTGQTALHMAAAGGSPENVELLAEAGGEALLGTADKAGLLPLHVAIAKGNVGVGVIEPLLSARTVNVVAHSGDSPLRLAVLGGHLELAQLLLMRGADVNYRDSDGRSIVYCVVAFTHSTLEQKGPPFFNVAALYGTEGGGGVPDTAAYLESAVKTVHFLVRFGVDLEAKDAEGRTSIHVASWNGCLRLVEALITLGSDLNAVDNENRTPLLMASWNGHLEVVRLLVEAGATVNHVSSTQGATALLVAAQQGHLPTVAYLLRAGSDVGHRDRYGRDARDVALNCGHVDIVALLEEASAYLLLAEGQAVLAEQQPQSSVSRTEGGGSNSSFNSNTASASSSGAVKLSKYDPRFYSASGSSSKASKKSKSSIGTKLNKILH